MGSTRRSTNWGCTTLLGQTDMRLLLHSSTTLLEMEIVETQRPLGTLHVISSMLSLETLQTMKSL